jgi:spore coat protein SA
VRVLLINHRFLPAEGGTERWTYGLARALVRRGLEVSVLTQEEPGSPSREEMEGIQVNRLALRRVGGYRVPRRYWRTVRSMDHDLLHLSGNRIWCADFLLPVARLLPGPKVVTPHDFYQWVMEPSLRNRLYFQTYLPWALRAFGAYLALTESEAGRITGFGYPSRRVRVVGEGFDARDFAGPVTPLDLRVAHSIDRPYVALYVGGLWPNKRVDRLVEGLAPLRDQVALVVVGRDLPGTAHDLASVRSLAGRLGVELVFLGPLPQPDLVRVYRGADVYVQGSQYEGFGLALLEAMASGCPFVAFEAGAARELARQGGGRVVSNLPDFTEAVRGLLGSEEARRAAGARARKTAEGYDWDQVVSRYLEGYAQALEQAHR